MAMYEIESLVEESVKTLATAPSAPTQAKNLCFNLYQLQEQVDCGYTLLRVRDELEQLGYLYPLQPDQLPEPERSEALQLLQPGGFLTDGTYVDHQTGTCWLTAGSKLWQKLQAQGLLPQAAAAGEAIRALSPLDMAETIVPLAWELDEQGDPTGSHTLGLWYTLFPTLCLVAEGDDQPAPDRIENLLRLLATPAVFEYAETYVHEVNFDDFDDDEKEGLSFLAAWSAPYKDWKAKSVGRTPHFYKQKIYECLDKQEFAQADRYASCLAQDGEGEDLLHRSLVTIVCHQWLRDQPEGVEAPEGLLPVAEAQAYFERLIDLELPAKELNLCQFYLMQAYQLQGDYVSAVELLQQMCTTSIAHVDVLPEGNAKRIQQAFLANTYYQTLYRNFPDSYLPKKQLIQSGLPGLMDLPAVRQTCSDLLPEVPEHAETLRQTAAQCDLILSYLEK